MSNKAMGWAGFAIFIFIILLVISSCTNTSEQKKIKDLIADNIKGYHFREATNFQFNSIETERINETFSSPRETIKTLEGTFTVNSKQKRFKYVLKSVAGSEWHIQIYETEIK